MIKALLCKGKGLKISVKKTVFRDKSGLALLDVELFHELILPHLSLISPLTYMSLCSTPRCE